jgi:hypothetical protein
MPTVPIYDGPQVRQAALDGGFQQVQDVTAGQRAIAKGMGDLGEAVDRIDLQNATAEAQTAELKIREQWYEADAQLRQQYSGDKIAGYNAAVAQWWKDAPAKLGDGLTTRAQLIASKSLIGAQEMAQRTSFTYAAAKREELVQQKAADSIKLEQNSAAATVNAAMSSKDPRYMDLVASSMPAFVTNIQDKNAAQAALQNWTPEQLQLKNLNDTTQLHLNVIGALQANSPGDAKKYFDSVKANASQFLPTKVDEVERTLKPLADAQEAGGVAREVVNGYMAGKPLTAEFSIRDMDADLVKRFGDDPAKLTAARQELDRQKGLWNAQQSEHEAGAIENVFALKNKGMPISKLQAQPVWQNLSAKNQALLTKQWRDEADASLSREVNRMVLLERRKEMLAAPEMLQFYQNPEALVKMTPAEITQKAPTIGIDNAQKLIQMRQQYTTNQAKLSEGKIDADTFEAIALKAGIDPKPKAGDKDGAAKVWNLRRRVEDEIGRQQRAAKGELPRDVKTKIMTDMIHQEVLNPTWVPFSDGTATPWATMADEDVAKSSVKIQVPGTRGNTTKVVPLASIPTDEYATVEGKLRAAGRPYDPASVAQWWHNFKNQGAK